jgi:PIN domain nuclease of toxin-antitoxin system
MILLDTHALIWLAREPEKLSRTASEAIRKSPEAGGLAISAITLWEVAWLASHGRLQIHGALDAFVEKISSRTAVLPITPRIAALANQFGVNYPSDPADCLIGATALSEGIPLVTKDRSIRQAAAFRTVW